MSLDTLPHRISGKKSFAAASAMSTVENRISARDLHETPYQNFRGNNPQLSESKRA